MVSGHQLATRLKMYRQRLGHELHSRHYSQKCVGLVCPLQLPSPDKQQNLNSKSEIWLQWQCLSHKTDTFRAMPSELQNER